jgi:LysM repeat protein
MSAPSGGPTTRPTVPRATVAALLILVLSAGISFGFVVKRGGIDLPVVGGEPSSSAVADVAAETPLATAAPSESAGEAPTIITASRPPASTIPTESPGASPTPEPTPTATPTQAPTPSPTPTATPRPRPTATPASDRYKLLSACPDKPRCYIYTVRAGDNLYSIAHWFGVALSTIYDWNPTYANGAHLRAGDQIRMPPPTR